MGVSGPSLLIESTDSMICAMHGHSGCDVISDSLLLPVPPSRTDCYLGGGGDEKQIWNGLIFVSVWEAQGFSRLPMLGIGKFIRNGCSFSRSLHDFSPVLFPFLPPPFSDGVEVVVKVFPKHDEKVQLGPYDRRLTGKINDRQQPANEVAN